MAQDTDRYAAKRVINAAELATGPTMTQPEIFRTYLSDGDSAVRYWCVIGILRQGAAAVDVAANALRTALKDEAGNVRILAAEALARYSNPSDLQPSIEVLLREADAVKGSNYLAVAALNSLTEIGAEKIKPYRKQIAALPKENMKDVERSRGYVGRAIEYLLEITA